MIYFLCPKISKINSAIWKNFYDGAYRVLKSFKPHNITEIKDLNSFSLERASSQDVLIFFNSNENIYGLKKILEEGKKKKIGIFPISTSESNRNPIEIIDEFQSFDIVKEKKLRGLDDNYMELLGECFGREIIIKHYPAFFDEKIEIFLSHRRKDGEDLADTFQKFCHHEKETVFIDLHEVRVGMNAQKEINEKLTNKTDLVIFIQTKATLESIYQLKELKKAFELSLPILWVTVGLEKDKEFKELKLHPAGKPHFELDELEPSEITKIINCGFTMIKLKRQRLLDDVIYKFKTLKSKGINYKEICDRNNIYHIRQILNDGVFNKQTEQERLIKCLCRKYKNEDISELKGHLKDIYRENCILSLESESKELEKNIYLANYDDFLEDPKSEIEGAIIITGSFPESIDLKYQQNIIDALYTLIKEILARNGKIIFGSHPTFQGVILEKAKNLNLEYKNKIKLYVSKQFEGKYDIEYFKENSDVHEIEAASTKEISDSLTKMREAMINDNEVIALICVGGKESPTSLTNKPGIDEEINLARKREIPIYILGSTGGRSKELIEEGFQNNLKTEEEIEEVSHGYNFKYISEIILESLSK